MCVLTMINLHQTVMSTNANTLNNSLGTSLVNRRVMCPMYSSMSPDHTLNLYMSGHSAIALFIQYYMHIRKVGITLLFSYQKSTYKRIKYCNTALYKYRYFYDVQISVSMILYRNIVVSFPSYYLLQWRY